MNAAAKPARLSKTENREGKYEKAFVLDGVAARDAAAVLPAQADMTSEILENFGLTQTEATLLPRWWRRRHGPDRDGHPDAAGVVPRRRHGAEGTLLGNVYTDPNGVTVQVPEGWHVLEERMA